MQNNTAINLRRQKARSADDRRICWTTDNNISMWFDSWKDDIIELGFGTRDHWEGSHPTWAAPKDWELQQDMPVSQWQQHSLWWLPGKYYLWSLIRDWNCDIKEFVGVNPDYRKYCSQQGVPTSKLVSVKDKECWHCKNWSQCCRAQAMSAWKVWLQGREAMAHKIWNQWEGWNGQWWILEAHVWCHCIPLSWYSWPA